AQTQISAAQKRATDDLTTSLFSQRMTGWTVAARQLGEVLGVEFQSQMAGARGRGAALARGAGVAGLEGVTGVGAQALSNQLFGAAGVALGPLERLEALNKILKEAPKVAGESSDSIRTLIGTMAYFGASTDEMIDTLVRGSRESNLNALDVAHTYRSAN